MKKIIYIGFLLLFGLVSCHDDLDREPLDSVLDTDYWKEEAHVRYYAYKFLPKFFVGYNSGYATEYAPLSGYYFNDDVTVDGKVSRFEYMVPSSRSGTAWLASYSGPQWNFETIREVNIMLDRLEKMYAERLITEEVYKHWVGVGRFYRGLQTSKMVAVFGDMIYIDGLLDPDKSDPDVLYQDRKPRGEVMDRVYDDFKYAMENIRVKDNVEHNLDRYVAASFIARAMLIEGSFQKYHFNGDGEAMARAAKYFQFAVDAAEYVKSSGNYAITGDYRSLFTSLDLSGHKGVIMYRNYSKSLSVTHSIASASNTVEGQAYGANMNLIQSYICNDGKPWSESAVADANKFDIANLIKTRDSRFEGTFYNKATTKSVSFLYATKFCPRDKYNAGGDWISNLNITAAPVMRYAEVLLNWVEAKAELSEMGLAPFGQADLDISINAIRNRDLAKEAIAAGVKKTAPLMLSALPDDPARKDDALEVSALLWEIRRERRMEFAYEHSRILDLRRWRKLEYMDTKTRKTFKLGPWVNIKAEMPDRLSATYYGKLRVVKDLANPDSETVYNEGVSDADMVGFYVIPAASGSEREIDFNANDDALYYSPIGENDINEYARKGYKLTQTKGWPRK